MKLMVGVTSNLSLLYVIMVYVISQWEQGDVDSTTNVIRWGGWVGEAFYKYVIRLLRVPLRGLFSTSICTYVFKGCEKSMCYSKSK